MSKYICEKCNKPKPIDTDALQVGDKVKFTVKLIGRKSVEYKTRTGVITEIDGDFCSIESNGDIRVVKRGELTPSDAPSPMTWILGECECEVSNV